MLAGIFYFYFRLKKKKKKNKARTTQFGLGNMNTSYGGLLIQYGLGLTVSFVSLGKIF